MTIPESLALLHNFLQIEFSETEDFVKSIIAGPGPEALAVDQEQMSEAAGAGEDDIQNAFDLEEPIDDEGAKEDAAPDGGGAAAASVGGAGAAQ